jgi:hypothetical protein
LTGIPPRHHPVKGPGDPLGFYKELHETLDRMAAAWAATGR